jgi:hypothetical protein
MDRRQRGDTDAALTHGHRGGTSPASDRPSGSHIANGSEMLPWLAPLSCPLREY